MSLRINMDAKCERCGKKGATQRGLCLKCIGKEIKAGRIKAGRDKE